MSVASNNELIYGHRAAFLARARSHSDELFRLVRPDAIYERPIPERHRIIFYVGHLEAFDFNLICCDLHQMDSFNPEWDRLFAFGIDPTHGSLPDDVPDDWPDQEDVRRYNTRLRQTVDSCLNSDSAEGRLRFWVAIEHRLMHVETLAYMLHWLPFEQKVRQAVPMDLPDQAPSTRQVDIPEGEATLGAKTSEEFPFGWDNEFDAHTVHVPAFAIDDFPVTNT